MVSDVWDCIHMDAIPFDGDPLVAFRRRGAPRARSMALRAGPARLQCMTSRQLAPMASTRLMPRPFNWRPKPNPNPTSGGAPVAGTGGSNTAGSIIGGAGSSGGYAGTGGNDRRRAGQRRRRSLRFGRRFRRRLRHRRREHGWQRHGWCALGDLLVTPTSTGGELIDMSFVFDFTWGHTQISDVNISLPASSFPITYEIDYSRVYLR